MIYIERFLKEQLRLAMVEPKLLYRWRNELPRGALSAPTEQVITEYFESQPREYVDELAAFHQLNSDDREEKRVFVFVVCYNELSNLARIIEGYARQQGIDIRELQVSFLINYKLRDDIRKNTTDEQIFQSSISTLAKLREAFIHSHRRKVLLVEVRRSGPGEEVRYGLRALLLPSVTM